MAVYLAELGCISTLTRAPGWQTGPGTPPAERLGSRQCPTLSGRGLEKLLQGNETPGNRARFKSQKSLKGTLTLDKKIK